MSALLQVLILVTDLIVLGIAFTIIHQILVLGTVPPYIRTRRDVAEEIAELLGKLPPGSVLYDPGCGDGRVLRALARRNPEARFVGIELRRIPYLLARWKARKEGLANIELRQGDLFKESFASATHIYTYLYSEVMDRLLPKIAREVVSGTVLISLDFPFKEKEPERKIPLKAARPHRLGTTLYAYRF